MKKRVVPAQVKPGVMHRCSSIRIRWITRFAGRGVADVCFMKNDKEEEVIRIWGPCVDGREARQYALAIQRGDRVPDYIHHA